MLAVVNTPGRPDAVAIVIAIAEVDEPSPERHEAVVRVEAFSLDQGEITLMRERLDYDQAGHALPLPEGSKAGSAGPLPQRR